MPAQMFAEGLLQNYRYPESQVAEAICERIIPMDYDTTEVIEKGKSLAFCKCIDDRAVIFEVPRRFIRQIK